MPYLLVGDRPQVLCDAVAGSAKGLWEVLLSQGDHGSALGVVFESRDFLEAEVASGFEFIGVEVWREGLCQEQGQGGVELFADERRAESQMVVAGAVGAVYAEGIQGLIERP